jgi:hypothetical protein
MIRAPIPFVVLVAVALLSGSRARAEGDFSELFASGSGYTLVNLHPDEVRHKLYAVNYLQPGLIPLCSKVRFVSFERKKMVFQVESSGIEYRYDYHKAAVVPFEKHLSRYFGSKCDRSAVSKLGPVDQRGIEMGQVLAGMSKEGTIFAIGYPPPHKTPSLEMNEWRYWKNRFNTILVTFDEHGKVIGIQD